MITLRLSVQFHKICATIFMSNKTNSQYSHFYMLLYIFLHGKEADSWSDGSIIFISKSISKDLDLPRVYWRPCCLENGKKTVLWSWECPTPRHGEHKDVKCQLINSQLLNSFPNPFQTSKKIIWIYTHLSNICTSLWEWWAWWGFDAILSQNQIW